MKIPPKKAFTVIFVERNYDSFLLTIVIVLAAGGAGLGRGWPPWMRIKVFPGRTAAVPSRQLEEIVSRLPPAEMAARWRCGLITKYLKPHYNSQFCLHFNFCFDQDPLRCL